ncbi:hypothetical protein [Legionella brunensis]|uniref:Uncharacterized protein n=1 Tax=Legionella brunensis TaxID=29422 RepID=A0A0W0SU48_9GAMM|nr:hypothetical protein [Legionella brunensis]KTC86895.1 hypothetical protein Lbru_0124 [Legionella brunensis]
MYAKLLKGLTIKPYPTVTSKSYNDLFCFKRPYYSTSKALSFDANAVGNGTFLHSFMRDFGHLKEFHELVQKTPGETLVTMARTTNDEGDTPLDLIARNLNCTYYDKRELYSQFNELIKKHQKIKPLTGLVSMDHTSKEYDPHLDKELKENLELACSVMNSLRSVVKYSDTHPDLNHLSEKEKKRVTNRISDLRVACTDEKPELALSLCTKFAAGNCHDLSLAAIRLLQIKARRRLFANILEIENGDHVFVVFGSSPLPRPNQYSQKQTKFVFLDVWLGTFGKFYQDDLIKNLGNRKQYPLSVGIAMNVITSFNPNYHRLKIIETYEISNTQESELHDESETNMTSSFYKS